MTSLAFYLDSNDLQHQDRAIATLLRARAKVALLPCESLPYDGPHGPIVPRAPLAALAALCDRLRGVGVDPMIYSFPAVDGDMTDSLAHFRAACVACDAPGQLDAEPHGGHHWTPALYEQWVPFLDSVTTTRWERPHLGDPRVRVYVQAERIGSVALLLNGGVQPTDVVVIGDFDLPDQPRSLVDIKADLALATAQTKFAGMLGVWSCHATSDAEADLFAAWVTAQ